MPVFVVDLRQKSHGLINEAAVSRANEDLTKERVLLDENKYFKAFLKMKCIPNESE